MANTVVSGHYKGRGIVVSPRRLVMKISLHSDLEINKDTVERYELVSGIVDEQKGFKKSKIFKAFDFLTGGKFSKNDDYYTISLVFKDGKKSVIDLDERGFNVFNLIFS